MWMGQDKTLQLIIFCFLTNWVSFLILLLCLFFTQIVTAFSPLFSGFLPNGKIENEVFEKIVDDELWLILTYLRVFLSQKYSLWFSLFLFVKKERTQNPGKIPTYFHKFLGFLDFWKTFFLKNVFPNNPAFLRLFSLFLFPFFDTSQKKFGKKEKHKKFERQSRFF